MAVTLDALMTAGPVDSGRARSADNAQSDSGTGITVGVGATLLVVVVGWQMDLSTVEPTGRTVTWGGAALTEVAYINSTDSSTRSVSTAIYIKVSPASGAQTLATSWTNFGDAYISAASFTGTDTTTGITGAHTVTGTSGTTVTVTSDTAGATLAMSMRDGNDPTVNFNEIFSFADLAPGGGASYQLGGTSNAHTFTFSSGSFNAWAGIHIIAAGGGAGVTDGWKILLH